MNAQASIALEHFVEDFDAFLSACNDLEESGAWDVVDMGPMAAYFEADLFAVTLQVMRADGVFERAEAEVLNTMFSLQYTPRQLSQIYHSTKPVVEDYCDEGSDDALAILSRVDQKLAETYRGLLLEACRIVSLSDGDTEKSERMLIAQLREALQD